MVKGLCKVNVAWEEQANGPEGAYCRVTIALIRDFSVCNGYVSHKFHVGDMEVARPAMSAVAQVCILIPTGSFSVELGTTQSLPTFLEILEKLLSKYGYRKL